MYLNSSPISIIFTLELLFFIIILIAGIGFITLFERKILGYTQYRISPNKNILLGLIQPVLDGLKLLLKTLLFPLSSTLLLYMLSSVLLFIIIFIINIIMVNLFTFLRLKFYFLIIFALFGLSVYSIIILGWSSFSKYGIIGGIRARRQTISYELLLSLLIIIFYHFYSSSSHKLSEHIRILFQVTISFITFILLLIECNRAPFDFTEGESELISGFNIELSSTVFVLIFLGEYGIIIFSSYLISLLNFYSSYTTCSIFFFTFIIIRSSFPRFRYDLLISFIWKILIFCLCCLLYYSIRAL